MLEEILVAQDIVVVEDAPNDRRPNPAVVARLGSRTIINVPIVLQEKRLGALGTGDLWRGRHPAAIARGARLFARARQSRGGVHQSNRRASEACAG